MVQAYYGTYHWNEQSFAISLTPILGLLEHLDDAEVQTKNTSEPRPNIQEHQNPTLLKTLLETVRGALLLHSVTINMLINTISFLSVCMNTQYCVEASRWTV
jgi:hypothetical protein